MPTIRTRPVCPAPASPVPRMGPVCTFPPGRPGMPVRLVCGRFPDPTGNVALGALALLDAVGVGDLAPGVAAWLRDEVVGDKADKATTLSGYGITDAYTKTEVNSLVASTGGKFLIVQVLPNVADADPKAIYLVPRSPGETNNVYDEYLRVEPTSGTYAWEKIGSTTIDLSGYVQTTDSRLSDARTPTAHKSSHATGGADALSPADIGAAQASHTHAQSDVTGLAAALAGKRGLADMRVPSAPYLNNETPVGTFDLDGSAMEYSPAAFTWNLDYFEVFVYSAGSYRLTDFADPLDIKQADFALSAANGYTATALGHEIRGFVGTLAKVSDIPAASDATPQMDGTGAAGASNTFARADHVHPTDASRASANDVVLTPVYGGNGSPLSDWTILRGGDNVTSSVAQPVWANGNWLAIGSVLSGEISVGVQEPGASDEDAVSLTWLASLPDSPDTVTYTATRTENPVIGYTLGSQTTKPLQPKGEYAPATNIPKSALASGVQTSLGLADTAVQPSALRYDLLAARPGSLSVQLADRAVLRVELSAASTTLVLPALTDLSGKVADFGIDMVNAYEDSGTAAAASFQLGGTLGTDYNLIVPKGETWSDMTALAAGEMAVFYFTRSAFQSGDVPTWEVMKKIVEFVPVPTEP